MNKKNFSKNGFTIIELLLVVAILIFILSASMGSLASFWNRRNLQNSVQKIKQTTRRAQAQAMVRFKDSSWGIYLNEGAEQVVLFKGNSYASRDQNYDEQINLEGSVDLNDLNLAGTGAEIVFEKVSGETMNMGSLILDDKNSQDQYTLSVNQLGQIEVQ